MGASGAFCAPLSPRRLRRVVMRPRMRPWAWRDRDGAHPSQTECKSIPRRPTFAPKPETPALFTNPLRQPRSALRQVARIVCPLAVTVPRPHKLNTYEDFGRVRRFTPRRVGAESPDRARWFVAALQPRRALAPSNHSQAALSAFSFSRTRPAFSRATA